MVTILDFGAGNLRSAYHAIKFYDSETEIVDHSDHISRNTTALVLPGDGSFPFAFENLKKKGFVDFIRNHPELPILGICVGFQLLFTHSTEDGGSEVLDIVKGKVERFSCPEGFKVPHMGWNHVLTSKEDSLISKDSDNKYFYFVHSYRALAENREDVSLRCNYHEDFDCGVSKGNAFGFQFHPEKSQQQGWDIISNFVRCAREKSLMISWKDV